MIQKDLLPRFNIAALPTGLRTQEALYSAAASLRTFSDGYCLEPGKVLPHVTLCHFRARNEDEAAGLAEKFMATEFTLRLAGLYFPICVEPGHHGKIWIWQAVERNEALVKMQADIVEFLNAQNIEIFQRSGNAYFPHVTLALAARNTVFARALDMTTLYAAELMERPVAYRTCVGRSDEIGQYLYTIGGQA